MKKKKPDKSLKISPLQKTCTHCSREYKGYETVVTQGFLEDSGGFYKYRLIQRDEGLGNGAFRVVHRAQFRRGNQSEWIDCSLPDNPILEALFAELSRTNVRGVLDYGGRVVTITARDN